MILDDRALERANARARERRTRREVALQIIRVELKYIPASLASPRAPRAPRRARYKNFFLGRPYRSSFASCGRRRRHQSSVDSI
jgi:hypothetical protein